MKKDSISSQTAMSSVDPAQQPDAAATQPLVTDTSIRARAILLGLLLIPLNAYWVVNMEFTRYSAHPTTVSLFFNCIFLLIVVVGINRLVACAHRQWALRKAELLLIYSMLCIGSCMAAQISRRFSSPACAGRMGCQHQHMITRICCGVTCRAGLS